MPNIKPVSDLRNYTEVLRDIAVGEPVFLTKNGRGRYAIVDMEEYEKTKAVIKLMGELSKGEQSTGVTGVRFFQVVDGKILFQRGYWDKLLFLKQHNLPIE